MLTLDMPWIQECSSSYVILHLYILKCVLGGASLLAKYLSCSFRKMCRLKNRNFEDDSRMSIGSTCKMVRNILEGPFQIVCFVSLSMTLSHRKKILSSLIVFINIEHYWLLMMRVMVIQSLAKDPNSSSSISMAGLRERFFWFNIEYR